MNLILILHYINFVCVTEAFQLFQHLHVFMGGALQRMVKLWDGCVWLLGFIIVRA